MTRLLSQINLQGSLYLKLEQDLIKIECEGQCVKLIFTSFKILKNFIYCHLNLKRTLYPASIQDFFSQFDITYYLGDKLIGRSNSYLTPSWLGKYLGLEKSNFYFFQFLSYFFSSKNT